MLKAWTDFFFEAMSGPCSYAGGAEAAPVPKMPGWKGYEVVLGRHKLIDYFLSLPGGFSMGYIMQWMDDQILLQMNYGGWYQDKDATTFLRQVLLEQYRKHQFYGLRGPAQHVGDKFIYRNTPEHGVYWRNELVGTTRLAHSVNRWWQDTGHEIMVTHDKVESLVGWHDYHYMIHEPRNKTGA